MNCPEGGSELLNKPTLSPRERIILPLDFDTLDEAGRWAARLKGHVGLFKVGLELFTAEGPRSVLEVQRIADNRIFLDLKLHDIPETVRRTVAALKPLSDGVQFLTAHAAGSASMLEAAVEAAADKIMILGVSVLTSTGDDDSVDRGYAETVSGRVLELAKKAQTAGCAGVVCSAKEARSVRQACGPDFIVVTPGIRPEWSDVKKDDQRRVTTPAEAVTQGADYVVVGRPVTRADDPVRAADRIAEEIDQALRDRAG
jgi:orotidine-5'-phosphate decarboxylase